MTSLMASVKCLCDVACRKGFEGLGSSHGLPQLRTREPGRIRVLRPLRRRPRSGLRRARGAKDRDRAVRGRRRLDLPRRVARSRACARTDGPLVRAGPPDDRGPRRDGREVRRRCSDGGVRGTGRPRGRRAAGRTFGRGAAQPGAPDRRQHRRGRRGRGRDDGDGRRRQRRRATRAGGAAGRGVDRQGDTGPGARRRRSGAARPARSEGEGRADRGLPARFGTPGGGGDHAASGGPTRRTEARAGTAPPRLRARRRRAELPSIHAARDRGGRQIPPRSRVPRRRRRPGRARPLPYGEGITYFPLVEVLMKLGAEPESIIASSPAETQLAFRKLLEREATDGPLIVVFEDIQWAEPTFLDLIEHISDLSRSAPIFLLCIARPELLELRPTWSGGKLNTTTILLEPLSETECGQLISTLGGADGELQAKVIEAAQGNPLFVEEMLAMLHEEGDVAVPPTIHALLHARLDALGRDERAVMDRGAVEGQVF